MICFVSRNFDNAGRSWNDFGETSDSDVSVKSVQLAVDTLNI